MAWCDELEGISKESVLAWPSYCLGIRIEDLRIAMKILKSDQPICDIYSHRVLPEQVPNTLVGLVLMES